MNFLGIFLVMFPMSAAVKPVSKDGKPCTLRHFKKASSGNQALRPSNLISSHNVDLLVECHLHCVNAGNCYGYNFRVRPRSIYTTNCQLSNSSVKMNMTKMRNGSWNFYEDVLVTKDIDECSQDSHKCHSNATCINTPGSYDCQCRSGYTGSGRSCADIDECLDKSNHCHSNANCINTDGSYKCKCCQGYRGNGQNCTDIDECSEGSHGCRADATCYNTQGSYNCTCPGGAYIARNKYCQNLKVVSEILKNEPNEFENKLREWLPRTGNWRVCWRAPRDGWAASTFHSNCDGKLPTLTIVQVIKNRKKFVFGGYATVSWKRYYNHGHYTSAPGSFLFSLRNNDDLPPFKAPLKDQNHGSAIYRYSGYGPTFGGGHDLRIAYANSLTNFGHTYQPPHGYTHGQANTHSLLAGSYSFTPSEVEVLYLN